MSSAPLARPGLYKADSIIDVADSLNITNLSEVVAGALASDVEYRLHQIIEEAARFTRHSRRTMMTTSDIDQALKTLNIEPVYGHSGLTPMSFRKIQPSSGPPVYVVDDEEIDFETILKEEPVPIPRAARYTAHWLAIEGVQPLIPENPPPEALSSTDQKTSTTNGASASGITSNTHTQSTQTSSSQTAVAVDPSDSGVKQTSKLPSVKSHLSRELQHYYQRLISALVPSPSSEDRKRTAALTSLRADAGLAPVLPYIARWVAEGVVSTLRRDGDGDEVDVDRRSLDIYLDVIAALLENERLLVEPYLHQFLPPILSILLTSTLFISQPLTPLPTAPTPSHLRTHASSVLARLLAQHGATYPSLSSRITKTLLAALVEPGRMLGTREGALRGLASVGREAVRRGVGKAGGGRVVGEDCERAREMGVVDVSGVEEAMMDALQLLHPQAREQEQGQQQQPLNDMDDLDRSAAEVLAQAFSAETGFYRTIVADGAWARGLARAIAGDGEGDGGVHG